MVNQTLLSLLVCPQCKGKLTYDEKHQELICRFDRLAFPIKDDIPVMLVDEAREVSSEELS